MKCYKNVTTAQKSWLLGQEWHGFHFFYLIWSNWPEVGWVGGIYWCHKRGLRIIGGWGEDKSFLQLIGEDNRWGQLAPQAGHKVIDVTTWSLGQLPDNRLKLYQSFLYCCQCFFFASTLNRNPLTQIECQRIQVFSRTKQWKFSNLFWRQLFLDTKLESSRTQQSGWPVFASIYKYIYIQTNKQTNRAVDRVGAVQIHPLVVLWAENDKNTLNGLTPSIKEMLHSPFEGFSTPFFNWPVNGDAVFQPVAVVRLALDPVGVTERLTTENRWNIEKVFSKVWLSLSLHIF